MLSKEQRPTLFVEKITKKITINIFTLADEQWLIDLYGDEDLFDKMRKGDSESVAPILNIGWHQLDVESKKLLIKQDFYNDMAEKIEIKDHVEIMKHTLTSAEVVGLFSAIIEAKTKSVPVVEHDQPEKKKKIK
jgi:hypothetical protein